MDGETAIAPENVSLPVEDLSEEEDFHDSSEGYEASNEEEEGEDLRSKGKGKEKKSSRTKGKVACLIEMLPPEIRETYAFRCHCLQNHRYVAKTIVLILVFSTSPIPKPSPPSSSSPMPGAPARKLPISTPTTFRVALPSRAPTTLSPGPSLTTVYPC